MMQSRLEFPCFHTHDLLMLHDCCFNDLSSMRHESYIETWRRQALSTGFTALVDKDTRSFPREDSLQQLEMPSNLIYDALRCRADT